jgi:ABC-type uncharacterized transport system involved in gliding motility auxiliary subunit
MRKYAFLPGAVMAVGALLWAAYLLRWTAPAVALGAGGLLALGVGVAANWTGIREWFRDPRGVFAVNSIISTLLLAAVLGLVNAMAGLRATTFDWTEAGRNTLSPGTTALLDRLSQDVVLKQFGRAPDALVGNVLGGFSARSRRIRVEFVDIERAPQVVRRYGVTRPGTVVTESGGRFRKVETLTEPALATAILQVTSSAELLACFATGEGEHGLADTGAQGLSGLAAVLTASNYRIDRVNLAQGEVPQGCSVLVIAGAPKGLSPDALARVDRYLARGGRLGLLLDPPVDRLVADYLRPFGIRVGEGVIIETSGAGRAVGAGPENPVALVYHEHPITRGFEQRTIFGRAVPLAVASTDLGMPTPLVSTADTAFERVDLMSQATELRQGRDRQGPFLLAVATTIPRGSRDAALPEPRIVVVGDSDFLANGFITWTANRDLAVRMIAWLAGEEDAHVVSVGERQNRRITMTEGGRTAMYLVNLGLLPLLPLVAGLVQFLRSRR